MWWFVDPDLGRGWRGQRRTIDEAFGVDDVGSVKNCLALLDDKRGLAMVKHRGSEQTDPGVMMILVVPAEEVDGKDSGVLDRSEAVGEAWPILQGAELAFRVRVVVGDVGAAVGLGDPEIAEEESYRLGGHG